MKNYKIKLYKKINKLYILNKNYIILILIKIISMGQPEKKEYKRNWMLSKKINIKEENNNNHLTKDNIRNKTKK